MLRPYKLTFLMATDDKLFLLVKPWCKYPTVKAAIKQINCQNYTFTLAQSSLTGNSWVLYWLNSF